MAKSTQERSAKSAAKRIEYDEKELRLRCRKGTRNVLQELMDWANDTERGSVIVASLRYVHSLGPAAAGEALRSRHEITISETVARKLHEEGARQATATRDED